MVDTLPPDAYDALVTAAGTHRAAVVVRLAGEAGLRTGEIVRVRPRDLREAGSIPDASLLSIPAAGSGSVEGDADGGSAPTGTSIDRETAVSASLAAALRRYAESEDLAPDDPFVDVSTRRVQMLVRETAERAAVRRDEPSLASTTPRDLRRTFARRLLVDRGVDPHVVREAGGWETMDALEPHLDPLDGEAIAAALADADRVDDGSALDDGERTGDEDAIGDGERTGDGKRTGDGDAIGGSALLGAFEAIATASEGGTAFEAVVERATDGDRWRAAWVVRGRPADDREDVLAAATDGEAALDDVRDGDGRAVTAPVEHRGTDYGRVCLLADGEPVTPGERRAVTALGRALGWAVTADRWRDLLHSDAVTAVEFHTASEAAFLASTSAALDCRIALESTVVVSGSASRWYLAVTGAGPQAVANAVETADGLSELRVIETREGGCAVSVRATGGSIVRALTGHGATVREAAAEDGQVRVVADLPDGTDVRRIADGLRESFPDARLVSKESVARSPGTESTLREGVADRLTDRQWATLSAAYHSGYFDWPRGSTAEEVADAMDVSSPTFHNHLRKAERALLETLFEDRDARDAV